MMKFLLEYNSYKVNPEDKLRNIVERLLDTKKGGEHFFDALDDAIKNPENEDITLALFNKIYQKYDKYRDDFNIVVSGSFGRRIIQMMKESKLYCGGTFVLFSGSITSHQNKMGLITKNKDVKVEFQNDSIGEGKEFIFIDDSYYSGTTYKLIKKFIEERKSTIKECYVIYDGNDTPEKTRHSLYSYYQNYSGRTWDKETLLNRLEKIEGANKEEVKKLILNGEVKTNRDLINSINHFWKKYKVDRYLDPRNFNFANQI